RSRFLHGVKNDDDLRIAPASAERLDARLCAMAVPTESRLADRAHAQPGAVERREMVVDGMRMKRDLVEGAVAAAKRAAPAQPRPRRMEIGIHEMATGRQNARHLARPGGDVRD